jgi:hypothetical protein
MVVGREAAHLLGRHVADRAEHQTGIRVRRRREVCRSRCRRSFFRQLDEAEVENLHVAVRRDEDIFRFQIAMHDPLVVGGGKPAGDLHRVLDGFTHRDRLAGQACPQRFPLEQFRDDVR